MSKDGRGVKRSMSAEDRLLFRREITATGCWEWTGALVSGYGRLVIDRQWHNAHRLSYQLFRGEIPEGLVVDHVCHSIDLSCNGGACRHRRCFNPDHLELVSQQENVRRGRSTGAVALRRELCIHGHSYAEWGADNCGRRICRFCRTAYLRVYKDMTFAQVAERKNANVPVVDLEALFADPIAMERYGLNDLVIQDNGRTGVRDQAVA